MEKKYIHLLNHEVVFDYFLTQLITVYLLLIKYVKLIRLFIIVNIYVLFNPINLFSLALCDVIPEDGVDQLSDEKNNTEITYKDILLIVCISAAIMGTFFVASYYYPNLDYFNFWQHSAPVDYTTIITNLEEDISKLEDKVVLLETDINVLNKIISEKNTEINLLNEKNQQVTTDNIRLSTTLKSQEAAIEAIENYKNVKEAQTAILENRNNEMRSIIYQINDIYERDRQAAEKLAKEAAQKYHK